MTTTPAHGPLQAGVVSRFADLEPAEVARLRARGCTCKPSKSVGAFTVWAHTDECGTNPLHGQET